MLLIVLTSQTFADCKRFERKETGPHQRPEFDGPGSFGALHGTLTLGCLVLNGVALLDGVPVATVVDEKGKSYFIRVGSYVGEFDGMVTEIRDSEIFIRQLFYKEGEWVKKYVILSKE